MPEGEPVGTGGGLAGAVAAVAPGDAQTLWARRVPFTSFVLLQRAEYHLPFPLLRLLEEDGARRRHNQSHFRANDMHNGVNVGDLHDGQGVVAP